MGNAGDSPTGDREAPPEEDVLRCAACGEPIDPSEWHPVRTWVDSDDEFHVDAFCSMACRADGSE